LETTFRRCHPLVEGISLDSAVIFLHVSVSKEGRKKFDHFFEMNLTKEKQPNHSEIKTSFSHFLNKQTKPSTRKAIGFVMGLLSSSTQKYFVFSVFALLDILFLMMNCQAQ
jgi:hypothetical protein